MFCPCLTPVGYIQVRFLPTACSLYITHYSFCCISALLKGIGDCLVAYETVSIRCSAVESGNPHERNIEHAWKIHPRDTSNVSVSRGGYIFTEWTGVEIFFFFKFSMLMQKYRNAIHISSDESNVSGARCSDMWFLWYVARIVMFNT